MKDNLKPVCGVKDFDLCDAETRKKLEDLMAMPYSELATLGETQRAAKAKADKAFKDFHKSYEAKLKKANNDKAKLEKDLPFAEDQADRNFKQEMEDIRQEVLVALKKKEEADKEAEEGWAWTRSALAHRKREEL